MAVLLLERSSTQNISDQKYIIVTNLYQVSFLFIFFTFHYHFDYWGVKVNGFKCYWIKKQIEPFCIHPKIRTFAILLLLRYCKYVWLFCRQAGCAQLLYTQFTPGITMWDGHVTSLGQTPEFHSSVSSHKMTKTNEIISTNAVI